MANPTPPRPTVQVTDQGTKKELTIEREGKGKKYEIVGDTTNDKIKDAVEKVLSDPHSAEWLP